jgi:di/tricarboxylate transporter
VDTSRVSFGEMVAAAGGVVLLVLMFVPWFGGHLSDIGAPVRVDSASGWESFGGLFDVLITLATAIAIAVAVGRAMDALPRLPVEQALLVMGAGAVLFAIIAVRMIDPPGLVENPELEVETSRKIAAFLALAAAGAIAYGGHLQRSERV